MAKVPVRGDLRELSLSSVSSLFFSGGITDFPHGMGALSEVDGGGTWPLPGGKETSRSLVLS